MITLFFLLYAFLWTCAIPYLKKHKRMKHGFKERLVKVDYNASTLKEDPILIYASSGGEALIANCFIEKQIREGKFAKNQVIYCFSWTKEGIGTFKKFAHTEINIKNGLDMRIFYTPFDKPSLIYKALKEIAPKECYIIETEIWFGLLRALNKLDIPFIFVNARMTEKVHKNLSYFKWIFKHFMPTEVRALTKEDLERFRLLFQMPKNYLGLSIQENLKFDMARSLLKETKKQEHTIHKVPILLFASIREQEEELIFLCIEAIRHLNNEVCIIVCPKQLDRAEFWREKFLTLENREKIVLASEKRLDIEHLEGQLQIGHRNFIWDTFGQLQKLYGQANIVYIGGSLVPLGGQNFIEPLVYGVRPFVGRHLDNFKWVFEKKPDLRTTKFITIVKDKRELVQNVINYLKTFSRKKAYKEKEIVQQAFEKWLG